MESLAVPLMASGRKDTQEFFQDESESIDMDRDHFLSPDSQNSIPPSTPTSRNRVMFSDSPHTVYSYSSRNPDMPAMSVHDLITSSPTQNFPVHPYGSQSGRSAHSLPPSPIASRWAPFVSATLSSEPPAESGRIVGYDTLNTQADLDSEWTGHAWDEVESRKSIKSHKGNWSKKTLSRKKFLPEKEPYKRVASKQSSHSHLSRPKYFDDWQREGKERSRSALLYNPHVPLIFRGISFILSLIALASACSVYGKSKHQYPGVQQQASTVMTISCQSVALFYLIYVGYDEFSGKPLGLRDAKEKVRLIMLDVLFIIFASATLSLAFNTLYDSLWLCQVDPDDISSIPYAQSFLPYNAQICSRQRVLASFLFLSLVSYVSTFTISIFRLVERVTQQ